MEPFPRSPATDGGFLSDGGGPASPGSQALPEAEPGFLTRCVALFSAPRSAFRSPRRLAFWLFPLIVILVVNVVDGVVLSDLYEAQTFETIESNRVLTEEQRTMMLEKMESGSEAGTTVGSVLKMTGGVVFNEVIVFSVLGLFYLLGVNFGLAGQARYLDVVGVLALSWMALVPRVLLTLPLKLSQGTLAIYTGPAALVSQDGGWLATVLGFFDLFDLYRLFLITIGLSVVGRVKASRSAILVAAFWLLACGMRVVWKLILDGGLTA